MSYESIAMDGLAEGESAVKLDTGEIVAVRVSVLDDRPGMIYYRVSTRMLDAGGQAAKSATGRPIAADLTHGVPIEQDGADVLDGCIAAALGEPQAIWSGDAHARFLASASIRSAIQIGKRAGPIRSLAAHLTPTAKAVPAQSEAATSTAADGDASSPADPSS